MSEEQLGQPDSLSPPPTGPAPGAPVWMAIRRLDAWSVGRINGVTGAIMGLIIGGLYGIVLVIVAVVSGEGGMAIAGVAVAIGAPVFYGVVGLLGGAFGAWLYGVVAKWVGPIRWEVEVE